MSCFLQDGTGDLVLTLGSNGGKNLTLVSGVSQCAAQKLTNRFLLFAGEWFLNTAVGLLYYQLIAVKNPDLSVLKSYFTKVVLSVPGIVQVNGLQLALNSRRQASLALQALTDEGFVIVGGPGNAFVVNGA